MAAICFGILGQGAEIVAFLDALSARSDAEVAGCFDTSDALLSATGIDAVIIGAGEAATPETLLLALAEGLHVLGPFPPPLAVEDLIRLRRGESQAPGQVLKFASRHQWHKSVRAARAHMAEAAPGALLSLRGLIGRAGQPAKPKDTTGLLAGEGFALLDLMLAFCGPVQDVTALISADDALASHIERNLLAVMRTHDGALASLHASTTQWRETFRLELGFADGALWLEGFEAPGLPYGTETLVKVRRAAGCPHEEAVVTFDGDDSAAHDVSDFIDAIRTGGRPRFGRSEQVFDTINTLQRIYAADPYFARP